MIRCPPLRRRKPVVMVTAGGPEFRDTRAFDLEFWRRVGTEGLFSAA
jgi:hypothetical protein